MDTKKTFASLITLSMLIPLLSGFASAQNSSSLISTPIEKASQTTSAQQVPDESELIFYDDMQEYSDSTQSYNQFKVKSQGGTYTLSSYAYMNNRDITMYYYFEGGDPRATLSLDKGTIGYKNIYVRITSKAGLGKASWYNDNYSQQLGTIDGPNTYTFLLTSEADNCSKFCLDLSSDYKSARANSPRTVISDVFHVQKIEIFGQRITDIGEKTTGKTIIYGDVTDNGIVDSGDYYTMKSYLLSKIDRCQGADWKTAGDLNKDGVIDIADYSILNSYLLKRITSLPYIP